MNYFLCIQVVYCKYNKACKPAQIKKVRHDASLGRFGFITDEEQVKLFYICYLRYENKNDNHD